jgi:hypothetical protein
MTLFQACLNGNETDAVKHAKEMISRGQPDALWAILMHAAAWHEQREFDTPHSGIMAYSTHRMVEDLGNNPNLLSQDTGKPLVKVPDELREPLQRALVERLALHLAAIDHWVREKGPKYNVETQLESLSSSLRNYEQAVRDQSHMSALKAALRLGAREDPIRLKRMTASLAAEDPDNLGHAFIMPMSIIEELPHTNFKLPYQATLWHLTEYLVRKVPMKAPDGFRVDAQMERMANPTDLSKHKVVFANAAVEYGILGHNGIFAHRIAAAAKAGYVHSDTASWLLERLKKNIGSKFLTSSQLAVDNLIKKKPGIDWEQLPSGIDLPDSGKVRLWLVKNASDYWDKMMDLKSEVFERVIPDIPKKDWSTIRAAQYAMPTVNGAPQASHVTIFTHAIWSLVDHGLIGNDLAALHVHRMLREYLKGR